MRIGIDVGGTNTDAVLVEGQRVVAAVKTPTTSDVLCGITNALSALRARAGNTVHGAHAVVIGTTHFTNAIVERRGLSRVGVLRVCLRRSMNVRRARRPNASPMQAYQRWRSLRCSPRFALRMRSARPISCGRSCRRPPLRSLEISDVSVSSSVKTPRFSMHHYGSSRETRRMRSRRRSRRAGLTRRSISRRTTAL
jgi:hypothetical protein